VAGEQSPSKTSRRAHFKGWVVVVAESYRPRKRVYVLVFEGAGGGGGKGHPTLKMSALVVEGGGGVLLRMKGWC